MDDYGDDDYQAMDYTEEEIRSFHLAEEAQQRAAEREYRRAEEAHLFARDEYVRGQQARKAALERHAAMNPYAALYMADAKDLGGSAVDFDFEAPSSARASQARPQTMDEWDTALKEDRKIRNREGLMHYPAPPPMHPMVHPMGPLHAHMPMPMMERALHQEEHIHHMQMAQAARQHQARQYDLTMQQQYQYYRGPNEKSDRQRFQPMGKTRHGH